MVEALNFRGITVQPQWSSGPFSVDILEGNDHRIATLRGDLAIRMYHLCAGYVADKIPRHQFNCYNAVRFVLGKTDEVTSENRMHMQGEKWYVEDAMRSMSLPFVFQICYNRAVQHTGLILGRNRASVPAAFDKNGSDELRFLPWSDIWPGYFLHNDRRDRYVTCFEAKDIQR